MDMFEKFVKDLVRSGMPERVAKEQVYEMAYTEIDFTKNIIAKLTARSVPYDLALKRAGKLWRRHNQLVWCDFHDSKQDWYKKQQKKWAA